MASRRPWWAAFVLLLLGLAATASAATGVETEISGVDGPELANVRAYLSLVRAERQPAAAAWRIGKKAAAAPEEIRDALRPFGYYQPQVDVRLIEPTRADQAWQAVIKIDPGEPVRIATLDLQISGPAAEDVSFQQWQAAWPLPLGSVMQEPLWDSALRGLSELAGKLGYFDYRFVERRFWVDPSRGEVEIRLHFDSGQRYRFGELRGDPLPFRDQVLERLTVIEPDEPYTSGKVDEQREVLAGSGLFDRIVIEEERDRETGVVDLHYELNPRPPNSYRATVGFGTDTGARFQLHWIRHYLSTLGNRLDSGFGVQQRDREFVVRSEYLHPFGDDPGAFLTAGGVIRRQRDEFRFRDEREGEDKFEPFNGSREQLEFRIGRLTEREHRRHRIGALQERLFVALLHERFDAFRDARLTEQNEALLAANPDLEPFLKTETNTLALGAGWTLPNITGTGFASQGHILEARLLGAHRSLGSDVSFAQGYLRGRWHRIFGDRHKLLLGAEIGYTEANVQTLDVTLDDGMLELSITELPERYRFKTGGDRTVRGYGFETLSTNRNGANHLLTGTVEYEYRVGENWSVGLFYDIGNAFNDWKDRELQRGVGFGFRWYTVIGPVQIDIARPVDDADRSHRLHFTIGTRLL